MPEVGSWFQVLRLMSYVFSLLCLFPIFSTLELDPLNLNFVHCQLLTADWVIQLLSYFVIKVWNLFFGA